MVSFPKIAKVKKTRKFFYHIFLWLPENTEKVLWYLFPFHNRTEINLGSWALLGLSLLIIFTSWY